MIALSYTGFQRRRNTAIATARVILMMNIKCVLGRDGERRAIALSRRQHLHFKSDLMRGRRLARREGL